MVRYWCEEKCEVVTAYVTLMFGCCTHEELQDNFVALQVNLILPKLLLKKFFNLSSDGPYVNTALYRVLNESLKKFGHKRLLPLLICRLHTVHDGFNKRILVFGQDCEELAFDLHSWFSQSLYKEGDYLNLAKDSCLDNESLFFQHLNKHWLISAPALERIKKCWEDAKAYFLIHVANKPGYREVLLQPRWLFQTPGSLLE